MSWRLLVTEPTDRATKMAVDEGLWRSRRAGTSPPTLRFYAWAPPTVSLGDGQSLEKAGVTRRRLVVVLTATLAAAVMGPAFAAFAQTSARIPRVGVLRAGSPPDPFLETFKLGLGELGYVEGRNVILEYRWAHGREERVSDLAAELVRAKVEVIVASGTVVVGAIKRTTATIPIVMLAGGDPVAAGLVTSFARPGGNVTGFSVQNDELAGKWLGMLRQAFPKITRVAILSDPSSDGRQLQSAEAAASTMRIRLQPLAITKLEDLGPAFEQARQQKAEALIVQGSPFLYAHRTTIVQLAARHRVPVLYHQKEFVIAGGLVSYGPDFHDLFRRFAVYVDKILKGAKVGDLPMQQASKFELVVNLKTARALGVTLPQSFLLLADEVIQ